MLPIRRYVLRSPDDSGGAAPEAASTVEVVTSAAAGAKSAEEIAAEAKPDDAGDKPADKPAETRQETGKKPAEKTEEAKGYWPPDWRKTVSKDDAKILARLERYASPEAAMQALIEAQNRISKGDLKPSLGKNATPEQLKEWREANGIPEAADKYDLGKDAETIAPEALAIVLKEAHATNQTPDQVKATVKAWEQIKNAAQADRAEKDLAAQKDAEDALRAEWGGEFRRNINLVHGLLDGTADPALKDKLLQGRLSDGTPIGSSPEALRMLLGLALVQNPTGVVVPGSEANPMQGVEGEIEKIETVLRTDRAAYNKDEKMQARYRELLVAREKLQPRRAA